MCENKVCIPEMKVYIGHYVPKMFWSRTLSLWRKSRFDAFGENGVFDGYVFFRSMGIENSFDGYKNKIR